QSVPLEPAIANVDPTADIFPGALITMSQEDLSTISLNDTGIFGIAMQRWATWITEGGIENDWDAYVAELEGVGLTQNVEIHQRYYDEFVASQGCRTPSGTPTRRGP